MKDRSDDPSHYERMLLPQLYLALLRVVNEAAVACLFS